MATPAKPQIDATGLQPTVGEPVSNSIERPYAANDDNHQEKSIAKTAVEGVKNSVDTVRNSMTPEKHSDTKDVTIKIEH